MLRAEPPKSHYQIQEKWKKTSMNKEIAAKVAGMVPLLQDFPGMVSEARRGYKESTEALPLGAEQKGTVSL